MEAEWSDSRRGLLASGERAPGIHWMGGWVRPTACLDAVTRRKNPCPRRESIPNRPARSLITILAELPRLQFACFLCYFERTCFGN
jgi:hypothetical protein